MPLAAAPAGTGGLRPNLALTYNHLAGNGLAGMRWTLSGFSAISRCPTTYAQDGSVEAIDYTSTDQFCLDGQRLVDIGGSEFRTEIETFQRIKKHGTAGSGPAYFTVEHGNGSISYYGYTSDSRIEKVGASDVRIYYISYTQDPFGNRISYGFDENTTTGEVLPDEVTWTSNSGQGLSAKYKISIVYETRPTDDQRAGYAPGGAKIASTKRIDKIQIFYNTSTEIATYDLSYTTPVSTGTKRSQLASVTLKRGSDSLPETTFTWQDGTAGWNSPSSTGKDAGSNPLVGDFNNDGRADIFVSLNNKWQVYPGTVAGGLDSAIDSGQSSTTNPALARVIDYNGDGKSDLLYQASTTWYVLPSNGSTFGSPISTGVSTASVAHADIRDFDGDGLQDWLYRIEDFVYWRRNTGSGFGSADDITPSVGATTTSITHPNEAPPNFNGDSRDDYIYENADCSYVYPYGLICEGVFHTSIATGSAYSAWESFGDFDQMSGTFTADIRVLDVNGDGLDDVLYAYMPDDTSYCQFWCIE